MSSDPIIAKKLATLQRKIELQEYAARRKQAEAATHRSTVLKSSKKIEQENQQRTLHLLQKETDRSGAVLEQKKIRQERIRTERARKSETAKINVAKAQEARLAAENEQERRTQAKLEAAKKNHGSFLESRSTIMSREYRVAQEKHKKAQEIEQARREHVEQALELEKERHEIASRGLNRAAIERRAEKSIKEVEVAKRCEEAKKRQHDKETEFQRQFRIAVLVGDMTRKHNSSARR